tara:strand:+ start:384 stop:809 length:426 start_codon:yes stop_codon:yes gene_type:complete
MPKSTKNTKKGISPTNIDKKEDLETKEISSKVDAGIPKQVANRMARRIAFTTGLPTLGGMGVFIGSYILISRGIADIPPALTLITSASLFLLGLGGLSYGILSASWDRNPGSILGFENIRPNITRMRSSLSGVNQKGNDSV